MFFQRGRKSLISSVFNYKHTTGGYDGTASHAGRARPLARPQGSLGRPQTTRGMHGGRLSRGTGASVGAAGGATGVSTLDGRRDHGARRDCCSRGGRGTGQPRLDCGRGAARSASTRLARPQAGASLAPAQRGGGVGGRGGGWEIWGRCGRRSAGSALLLTGVRPGGRALTVLL